jgi:predicted RNase H-like nuclease (RuvC/YqgF family)
VKILSTAGNAIGAAFAEGGVYSWVVTIVVALIMTGGGAWVFTRRSTARKLDQDGDRLKIDAFTAVSTVQNARDQALSNENTDFRALVLELTQKTLDLGAAISQIREEKDRQLEELRAEKDRQLEELRKELRELRGTNEEKTREVERLLIEFGQFKDAVRVMMDELRLHWGRGGPFPEILTRNTHLLEIVNPPEEG